MRGRTALDLTGQTFGFWTVIKAAPRQKGDGHARWFCQCKCGTKRSVCGQILRDGQSNSCGCLTVFRSTKHNHARHGHKSPEYNTWCWMIQRCTNPNNKRYKNYGGAGVVVCDRWLNSFGAFLEDMGLRPEGTSLGRILDMGNYEPGNVFWMTMQEQKLAAMNKRHLLKWFAMAAAA